eukprot:scaffold170550_cov19-Prasinocladus_malaysianus.AAC.1
MTSQLAWPDRRDHFQRGSPLVIVLLEVRHRLAVLLDHRLHLFIKIAPTAHWDSSINIALQQFSTATQLL